MFQQIREQADGSKPGTGNIIVKLVDLEHKIFDLNSIVECSIFRLDQYSTRYRMIANWTCWWGITDLQLPTLDLDQPMCIWIQGKQPSFNKLLSNIKDIKSRWIVYHLIASVSR